MSNKNNKYTLDQDAANDMLQNILKSCDIQPNDIPLNILQVRHNQNYLHLHILRAICFIFFLLTLLSPFAFVKPADKVVVEHRILNTINVIDHRHEGDYFYLTLNSNFHVDTQFSYIITDSGFQSGIVEYQAEKNLIIFPYPNENSTIYVYTVEGDLLQLYLQISSQ